MKNLESQLLAYTYSIRTLILFLLFSFGLPVHADTYNVADFTVAGVTSGDPEAEVHSKIADYFSISADELKLVEVKEKPDRKNVLASGENRTYEFGDFKVWVSLLPNYVHENDHSLVVSGVKFEPIWGVDSEVRLAFVERVRDEYIAQYGEPSSATKGSDTRLNQFYWCTAMTDHQRWPCVLDEPHVYLHQLWVSLKDETYKDAYSRAAR